MKSMKTKYVVLGVGCMVLLALLLATETNYQETASRSSGGSPVRTVSPIAEYAGVAHDTTANVSHAESTEYTSTHPVVGERATTLTVIDGDTVEVRMANGTVERVRYIGIDTPETVHPSKPVQCMGKEASAKNKELVLGQTVTLVRDVTDRDRYGRLLRYVYVGDTLINEVLVREGYASVYTYPPDVRHNERLQEAERLARAAGVGLWSGACDTFVSAPPQAPVSAPRGACDIKGNINVAGEKIYHMPGCKSYDKTAITESQGEQWFCSEGEAERAGWRKALNC
jgi:micrococcal nuclease